MIAPAYRSGAVPPSLETTDQRRADLLGYVVIQLDMDAIVARATTFASSVSIAAASSGTDQSVAASAGRITATVGVASQQWTLHVARAEAGNFTVGQVSLLALAVALAALAWAAGIWAAGQRLEAAAGAAAARAQLRLMTSLAPLVQESIDLGQILPEIATRLSDDLELDGIGFAVPDGAGGFRDLYGLGTVDRATPPRHTAEELDAGDSIALVLDRGGRTVGLLRARARRALTTDELQALRAAAELATAAIISGQLFEQQDAAIRGLREVDELKTAFLSTASHELRTPVAAIKGFATLLDEGWDGATDADHQLYAERILANANSLDVLVQDLLDFSRLERGRLSVSASPTDVTQLTADVLTRLSVLFARHELREDLQPTPLVLADREGLERSLTNLVSNAVRYSPAGSIVTVRTAPAPGGAELVVDDEGPGVPAADRERIFAALLPGHRRRRDPHPRHRHRPGGGEGVRRSGGRLGLGRREPRRRRPVPCVVGSRPQGGRAVIDVAPTKRKQA